MTARRQRPKIYPYHERKGMSGLLLDMFEDFERPVIGYNWNLDGYVPWPKVSRTYYRVAVHRMKKCGWVKEAKKEGKKFLKLTKKGQMRVLLCAMSECTPSSKRSWDGKWWLAMFDIPESGKLIRNHLRRVLTMVGFVRLQKSVYIAPYQLSEKAVQYLKESQLIRYIRILKVEEIDDDRELRKKFKLER